MNTWLLGLAEWVIGEILSKVDITKDAKAGIVTVLNLINNAIQKAVASQTGDLAVIAKDVALALDTAVKAIDAALSA